MSLGIAVTTTGGIVLAADSRQSYQNRKGMGRVGSDSAEKVFQLTSRVGVVVAGLAFLEENGTPRNISRYIEDFKRVHQLEKMTVEQISNELVKFISKSFKYKKLLSALPDQIASNLKHQGMELLESKPTDDGRLLFSFKDSEGNIQQGVAGIDGLNFLVAGYNNDGSHMVCNISIPGAVRVTRDNTQLGKEYGADWIGQTDVVARIVLGMDARAVALPFINEAISNSSDQVIKAQLSGLEYVIQWGAMTLQDAIDFSKLAIETTTSIQRFSDGIKMDPGDIPGVGGAVDIAFIGQDHEFKWINKKELSVH